MTQPWRTVAHFVAEPPEPRWRDALAARLGQRPRRIGTWAELAVYGARRCLDIAGEATLPSGAALRVGSLFCSNSATRSSVEQCRSGLPMPFGFLQSQPSQMLAALSQHLGWQGDARFVACRDPAAVLALVRSEADHPTGLLLGWVEEGNDERGLPMRCEWWRLLPPA
jgi:hypothetical protein